MTPGRPPVPASRPAKTLLREPDGAAGGDFDWPPAADDAAACSIVLLHAEADQFPRPTTAMLADESLQAFPDVDIETALDQFADVPAVARVLPIVREALAHDRPSARPPASRRRTAGMRSLAAVCIGASLALMPPPGLPPLEAYRPLDVPAKTEPRVVTPHRIGTPPGLRLAPTSVAEPRLGRVVPRDEDRIWTTLEELRAAYARLDAGAARDVWPSVDVDALAHAFDDLKSQELRFDRCDVTVHGARAWAVCTGQAIYVPRVGSAAFSSAARAWTFELTRTRERWMIASGRAS
jgi:hypothetical protein